MILLARLDLSFHLEGGWLHAQFGGCPSCARRFSVHCTCTAPAPSFMEFARESRRFGIAWVLFALAVALHVIDEATIS